MLDAIYRAFQSPDWWITAVFSGFITGVLASFVKDWLSKILASLSSQYNGRRKRLIIERENHINRIAADSNLLLIQYFETALSGIFFLIDFAILIFLSIAVSTVGKTQLSDFGKIFFTFAIITLGTAGSFALFYFKRHYGICRDVKRIYTKNKS